MLGGSSYCSPSSAARKVGRGILTVLRNQNPLDYSAISRRIWKKWSKQALAIPITWQPFPNNEAALAEDKSRKI
jgi:hypothetical protein